MVSRVHTRTVAAILKYCPLILPAILAFGAAAVPAQQNSLVGQWRGVFQGITITISIQSNGQYSQLAKSATAETEQAGPYRLVAPNTIIFSVTTWAPTSAPVFVPTSPTTGKWVQKTLSKPAGATDFYVFNGLNTMTLTDQTTHGSFTMTRVPQ
jgi:hypothetical protein